MFWVYYAAFHVTFALLTAVVRKYGVINSVVILAVFVATVVPLADRDIKHRRSCYSRS